MELDLVRVWSLWYRRWRSPKLRRLRIAYRLRGACNRDSELLPH